MKQGYQEIRSTGSHTYFDLRVCLLVFKIYRQLNDETHVHCRKASVFHRSSSGVRAGSVSPIQKDHYNLPKTNRPDVSTVANFRVRSYRQSVRSFMAHFEIVSPRWCVFTTEYQRFLFEVIPLNVTVRRLGIIIVIGTRLVPRKCRYNFPTAAAIRDGTLGKHRPRHSWRKNRVCRRVRARGRFCAHAAADSSCLIIVLETVGRTGLKSKNLPARR